MDINNHPCFNAEVRHRTGRIHLPVAPKCNVQCNFCNRKFDCTNESRPGVSTAVLKPAQALAYLSEVQEKVPNLTVVGIAGPGDPFANPEETMRTLELVHDQFPDKLLCISSNGLSILDYIPRLAELNVSHVTITVNAVDPVIGAQVYEWIHYNKKTYYGLEGARLLLEKQTEAIRLLKKLGVTVKINTVVIPRVNEHHVHEIARYVSELGADVQNCIPLIPVAGTPYEKLEEPSASSMRAVRAKTSIHIKQMSHCARCRADAVGLLGEKNSTEAQDLFEKSKAHFSFTHKPYIAVTSTDGVSINQHLGETDKLWIFGFKQGKVELVEKRQIEESEKNANKWENIATLISDCEVLLVSGIGQIPLNALTQKGIFVEAVEGLIQECTGAIFSGKSIPKMALRLAGSCGGGSGTCSGKGYKCS